MNLTEALRLLEVRVTGADSSRRAAAKASLAQTAAQKSITRNILDIDGDIKRLGLDAFDDELALEPAFRIKNLMKSLEREVDSFERGVNKAFRKAQ